MALVNDETQYETVCKEQFEKILDRLEEIHSKLFVGNGQPAINVRIDRLEQSHRSATKAMWIAIAAFITAGCGTIWAIMTGKTG